MNRRLKMLGAVCALMAGAPACRIRDAGTGSSIHIALPDAQAQVRAAYVSARQAEAAHDSAYAVRARGEGFVAKHPATSMRADLDTRGATLTKAGEPWSATLAGVRVGCAGEHFAAVERVGGPDVGPSVGPSANRVEYAERAGEAPLTEWYVLGQLGLEQGFTLSQSPCSHAGEDAVGDIVIEVGVDGLAPVVRGEGVDLRDAAGKTLLRYADLSAHDATGKTLPVGIGLDGGAIVLRIGGGARFPVEVDPLVWLQTAELVASDGVAGDYFGSIAVSGGTALVGAAGKTIGSNSNQGAAYVYVLSGSTWTQQQKLVASDGAAGDEFGASVAVSGSTAVVGARSKTVGTNAYQGAAYVFVHSGSTWTQQQELVASDGAANDGFGASVSVSGSTAVVGALYRVVGPGAGPGAAYAYVQSGGTWTEQQKLVASDGAGGDGFGASVSVSGSTAVVGAVYRTVGSNTAQGAAYVFVQSGSTWTQQQELVASDGAAYDEFASSVSVAGNTAVAGAFGKTVASNTGQGAAYVFVQSGSTWTQQQELVASDGAASDQFGVSVSVSGNTAVIGANRKTVGSNTAQGAAYVFVPSGSTWTQQQEFVPSDGAAYDEFGLSVSVSGSTAVVGANYKTVGSNPFQGAAYVYALGNGNPCAVVSDCASGYCVSGVCCDTACGPCGDCATGACTNLGAGAPGNPTCTPYVCSGSGANCPTSCTADAACIPGDYCSAGACVPQGGPGASCSSNDACLSGACLGSRCCTAACTTSGPCGATACDATGACVYPTTQCLAPAGPCDNGANCTGTSASCPADTFKPSTTVCHLSLGACDNTETCTGASAACPPSRRDAGTVCAAATPCLQVAVCSGLADTCPPQAPVADGTPCGSGNGVCAGGGCIVSDAGSTVADAGGAGTSSTGCGCGSQGGGTTFGLALLLMGAALGRKRVGAVSTRP